MRKIFGFLFMIVGLILIGVGSYNEFEKYEEELLREEKDNYYNGLYYASGDSIFVTQESDNVIKVKLNSETYEFVYNGDCYEEENTGFYIVFEDEELKLYKDGEIIKTLQKTKK